MTVDEPPRPQGTPDPDDGSWLAAWARHALACLPAERHLHTPEGVPAVPAACPYGSLGLETCVGIDGSFWVGRYEPGVGDETRWTKCSPRDDLSLLLSIKLGHPEWRALLPRRPADAALCGRCGGWGWAVPGVELLCEDCRGLGWRRDAGRGAAR